MSDITEGIGGAIEGALSGRAVEPRHGEGQQTKVPGQTIGTPAACSNCGAQPQGNYCQECGQKVHVHRTLSALGHDLVHGVLHLDGKFWSTIPLLVFKPGKLTRRYIEGERAKFVSPMAMFLFSVFAMFAVFQMVGLTVPTDLGTVNPVQLDRVVEQQAERVDREIETLDDQLAEADLSADERAELEQRRIELSDQRAALAQVGEMSVDDAVEGSTENGIPIATNGNDGMNIRLTGIEQLDEGLVKKWRENPTLMLYKLQANGYKFSWLLIPLSLPFVWLTFAWRRRFHAYDHAIFVTYSLSFMSLLFITVSLIALIPNAWPAVVTLVMLVPPIHLYKHLRGTYEISRFSALWRLVALSAFIWIVLALFLQALLLLGAF